MTLSELLMKANVSEITHENLPIIIDKFMEDPKGAMAATSVLLRSIVFLDVMPMGSLKKLIEILDAKDTYDAEDEQFKDGVMEIMNIIAKIKPQLSELMTKTREILEYQLQLKMENEKIPKRR